MNATQMSNEAGKLAHEIKTRFPAIADMDCGKWAKFIVMSAECIKKFGAENMETVLKHTAAEYLK